MFAVPDDILMMCAYFHCIVFSLLIFFLLLGCFVLACLLLCVLIIVILQLTTPCPFVLSTHQVTLPIFLILKFEMFFIIQFSRNFLFIYLAVKKFFFLEIIKYFKKKVSILSFQTSVIFLECFPYFFGTFIRKDDLI